MSAGKDSVNDTPCALGLRVHSGWAAAVVVARENGAEQILERRRIEIARTDVVGAVQPFHHAEKLGLDRARAHIDACAAESSRLALAGLEELVNALRSSRFSLCAAAILLSSGRQLPDLSKILASHALIHTAEGEFFRQAFREACSKLGIRVIGIRARDLHQEAASAFGKSATTLTQRIAHLGRQIGPPWTTDQKSAALGALIALKRTPIAA